MTDDDMRDLVERHIQAELAGDLDAIMATMVAEPTIEAFPGELVFDGADAVRTLYASQNLGDGRQRFENIRTWVGGGTVAREDQASVLMPDGEWLTFPMVSIFTFRDGLIASERAYWGVDYGSMTVDDQP